VRTSAGIGRHFELALAAAIRRARVIESAIRASTGGAFVVAIAGILAFAVVAIDANGQKSCGDRREAQGFGKSAALFAFDHPERQDRFLYRVDGGADGYRVRLVGKQAPFIGEAWERDETGTVRHIVDTCVDEPSLLARVP
jgi:hypothetical protein